MSAGSTTSSLTVILGRVLKTRTRAASKCHVSPALARTMVHDSMLYLDPGLDGYTQSDTSQEQTMTAILG